MLPRIRRTNQLAVLLVFLLTVTSLGFQRSADTLPARLGDDEYWQIITSFSEPDGSFISDNYVSNELTYQIVIPDLRQRTLPGGVYLGVGPEQNFSYIASIQPKIAFIIDIRRQNLLELMMYKALFEISDSRADFVAKLFSRPMTRELKPDSTAQTLFTHLSANPSEQLNRETMVAIDNNLRRKHGFKLTEEDLRKIAGVFKVFGQAGPAMDYNAGGRTRIPDIPTYYELMVATDGRRQNWSYLQSEERFQYLKALHEKNLIVPIVGDFSGPKAIQSVAQYLRGHNAIVTVFYVSNVEDYLEKGWSKFRRNIDTLPTDGSSMFIRYIAKRSVLNPMSLVPERWPGRRGAALPRKP